MEVGFLISTLRGEDNNRKFESALALRSLWNSCRRALLIDVQDEDCRIACLGSEEAGVWVESVQDCLASFVYVMGWCYRISSCGGSLGDSDYREILHRYRHGLPPISEDFSGNFAAVVFDTKQRRIAVQADRWGMEAVYFALREGRIAVSNRSMMVASATCAALDGHSVLSMMRGTHMPFGHSLFAGVRRLMCGSYLDISLASGVAEVRRPFPMFLSTQEISFQESVERVSDAVCAPARRLLDRGSTQFDLTGGNDTRLTAASISHVTRNGIAPKLGWRVLGAETDPDVRIARQIADLCGWKLLRLDRHLSTDASVDELRKATAQADGTCPLNAAWGRFASESESARFGTWDWQVGSAGGELLRGYFWRQERLSFARTSSVNHEALLAYRLYASRNVDCRILGEKGPSLRDHDEVLLGPYRQIDRMGNGLLNPYKLDVMYLHKLCYSAGNTLSWLAGFQNIRFPLLTWEVTRVALSVPWRFRTNRRLVLKVIGRLDPRLCGLANDRGEPMQPLNPSTFLAYASAALPLGADRISRILQHIAGRPAGAKDGFVHRAEASFLSILDESAELASVLDPLLIKRVRSQAGAAAPSADCLRVLYTLCTAELLLRSAPDLKRQIVFEGE
jgi:hypothetical protein